MFSEKDVRLTYQYLNHQSHGVTEVRVIRPQGGIVGIGYFDNEDDFVAACKAHNGRANIYAGIQPRPNRFLKDAPNQVRALNRGATDDDIETITSVVIDIDPTRPKHSASTEDELALAVERGKVVSGDLDGRGFVPPVPNMSGNGLQLWLATPAVPIDNGNRQHVRQQIKDFEADIRDRFSGDGVAIDSIHNPSRIIKVIGTLSVKGENTADRPHRLSKPLEDFTRREDEKLRDYLLTAPAELETTLKPAEPKTEIEKALDHLRRVAEAPDVDFENPCDMCGPVRTLWTKGHDDRSVAMFNLVLFFMNRGMDRDSIIALTLDFDRRCGQKLRKRDGEKYIANIIDKIEAQHGDDVPPPCRWLRSNGFCDPDDPCEDWERNFNIDLLLELIPSNLSEDERNRRLKIIFRKINLVSDSMERNGLIDKIHKRFDLPKNVIKRAVNEAAPKSTGGPAKGDYPRIMESDGVYKAMRGFVNGEPTYEPISDFVLRIKSLLLTSDGYERDVVFLKAGQQSPRIVMTARSMTSRVAFMTFCNNAGYYNFTGTDADLAHLWADIQSETPERIIAQPDHVGYVAAEDSWLFRNMLIKDGRVLQPDDEGIFWIGPGKGVRPAALSGNMDKGKKAMSSGSEIPYMAVNDDRAELERLAADLLDALRDNLGGYKAFLAIGWTLALVFQRELAARYDSFPILYLYGKRGCGKNTLANWLTQFWGLYDVGKNIAESTPTGISRRLSYFSALPVWFDEYRNEKRVAIKDGVLRDAYNFVGATKGIAANFGTRDVAVRGSLILTGEHLPEDNGLFSRCLVIQLSTLERRDSLYQRVNELIQGASSIITDLLIRKTPEAVAGFIENVETVRRKLKDDGLTDRDAYGYAVAAAGLFLLREDVEFLHWIRKDGDRVHEIKESETIVSGFLEDLCVMKAMGQLPQDFYDHHWVDGHLYLYFAGIYSIWAKELRQRTGDKAWGRNTILDQFQEESFFISRNIPHRFNGLVRKALKLDTAKLPEGVREAFEQ